MATNPPLTQAEYDNWLTPTQGLAMLPADWEYDIRVRWIASRLENSLMKSAGAFAWQIKRNSRHEKETLSGPFVVAPSLWQNWTPLGHHDFWQTGHVTFYERVSGEYFREYHDVKLDPAGFAQFTPVLQIHEMPTTRPSGRRQDLPILPDSIAVAWMAWIKSQPKHSKERAEKSALHMFPNHNLSRERIRDLYGDSSIGRPKNTDG